MRRTRIFSAAAATLLAASVYLNTLDFEFVYDDKTQIAQNPYIQDPRYLTSLFTTSVWEFQSTTVTRKESNYYRPIFMLSLALTDSVAGLNPRAFHGLSIAVHALCTLLVYLLALLLFGDGREWPALAAAALFAVHPIHTESVAWISGNTDPLCALFCLGALIAHIKTGSTASRRTWTASAAVAFFLALLTKETAIAVIPTAILYDLTLGRAASIRRRGAVYAAYGVAVAVYLALRVWALGGMAPIAPPFRELIRFWLANFPMFLYQCAEAAILPIRQSAYHVFVAAGTPWSVSVVIGYLALGGILVALALWQGRSGLWARFLAGWFVLFLLPLLPGKMNQPDVVAERYLYLPSVAVCLGAAALGAALARIKLGRAVATAALVLLVGIGCVRTISRNEVWKNEETLYEKTVADEPNAHVIRLNLAVRYMELGRSREAIAQLQELEARSPGFKDVYLNLGIAYHNLSEYDRAEACYLAALRQSPDEPKALFNLAHLQTISRRKPEAIATYRRLLVIAPDYPGAHFNLALTLMEVERFDEAIVELRATLGQAGIDAAEVYVQLGLAYRNLQLDDAALEMFTKATERDPAPASAFGFLANLYYLRGNYPEAVKALEAALAREPNNRLYRQNLAAAKKLAGETP